jgi:hypothetical protein
VFSGGVSSKHFLDHIGTCVDGLLVVCVPGADAGRRL